MGRSTVCWFTTSFWGTSMTTTPSDFELAKQVAEQLTTLDNDRQKRVLHWVAERLGLGVSAATSGDSRATMTKQVLPPVGALSGGQISKQVQGDRRIEMPTRLKELLAKTQQPKVLWSGKKASLVLMNNKVYRLGPMLEVVQM